MHTISFLVAETEAEEASAAIYDIEKKFGVQTVHIISKE